MRTKYDDMGKTAAEEFINEGTPLTESVRDIVKENSLNEKQARRVVEGANKRTFLSMFKEAEGDATFTFDLVDPEDVVGNADGKKEASVHQGGGEFSKEASANSENSFDDFSLSPSDHRESGVVKQIQDSVDQHNKEAKKRQNELKQEALLKKASVRADDFLSRKESELYELSFEGDAHKESLKEATFDLLKEGYDTGDIKNVISMTEDVSKETRKISSAVIKEALDERGSEIKEWRDSTQIQQKEAGEVINQDNPISNIMREIGDWSDRVKESQKEERIAEKVREEIEEKLNG